MKDKIHIVTTIDISYIQHLGVMLCSLFENNLENKFTVYVLVDFEDTALSKLKIIFNKYKQELKVISIDLALLKNVKVDGHISKATYFRLIMPDYLIKYTEKIIYLDTDIIIKDNLMPLWQTDLGKYPLAAVNEEIEESKNIFFNAGVLLIDLKYWIENNITQKCLEYAADNHEKIIFWDQDVLNEIFKGNWKQLDQKWNMTSNFLNQSSTKVFNSSQIGIIHFTGALKPWHFHCENQFKEEYFIYLKKTPWKKFHFKENTLYHHYKQLIKKVVNRLTGKKIFEIYV